MEALGKELDVIVFKIHPVEGTNVRTRELMAIHPVAVQTFHFKPQMSTSWCCYRSQDYQRHRDLSSGNVECQYKSLCQSMYVVISLNDIKQLHVGDAR